VESIFVLGDLLDKSVVDAITLTNTISAISDSPVPIRLLPGNHDAVYVDGGRFTLEAFGRMGLKGVEYMPKTYVIDEDWILFASLEFSTSEVARKRLAALKKESSFKRERMKVLLLHHSILGCEHNGWTCDDGLSPEEVMDGFDVVLSGHFHEHQKFHHGVDGLGMYLGAPMHHRYDDQKRQAGYWVIDFSDDGRAVSEFIDGMAPKFHEVPWMMGAKLPKLAAVGDYIRISANVTHPEWTTIKSDVAMKCAGWNKAGYRASYRHVPVYHHDVRLKSSKGKMDGRKPEEMVCDYVDSSDVDTSGLDISRLKRIGLEAITVSK